jgi:[ribosomal protein S18]-alanine N-acetyltransferase
VVIRLAREDDRAAIAAIQSASPEASSWDPAGYDVTVADLDGEVVGFLVTRRTAPDEVEVLNLAVAPRLRRTGVAKALLQPLLSSWEGVIFLEVRESNSPARRLYQSVGFKEVTYRRGYYAAPPEAAIVMTFHSC